MNEIRFIAFRLSIRQTSLSDQKKKQVDQETSWRSRELFAAGRGYILISNHL
jgi:hypothetical protein